MNTKPLDLEPDVLPNLPPMLEAAIRLAVVDELLTLGVLPSLSRIAIARRKQLEAQYRFASYRDRELFDDVPDFTSLPRRYLTLEKEFVKLRDRFNALSAAREAETPQPTPRSPGRCRRWLRRILRGSR